MSTIGERIAAFRLKRGMTQTELADAIGENKQLIYKYEKGIITNIPLQKVEAMAKALLCTPAELTGWDAPAHATEPELPEITLIARAGKKMSPDQRDLMLRWARMTFPEAFEEDKT